MGSLLNKKLTVIICDVSMTECFVISTGGSFANGMEKSQKKQRSLFASNDGRKLPLLKFILTEM